MINKESNQYSIEEAPKKVNDFVLKLPLKLLALSLIAAAPLAVLFIGDDPVVNPRQDPIFFVFILVVLSGSFSFLIFLLISYKIQANEDTLVFQTWPNEQNRSIECNTIKAIFVEHYIVRSRQTLLSTISVHLLLNDGEMFSVTHREDIFRPFVDYLHARFPGKIEEGYEPNQFERSRFISLRREIQSQQDIDETEDCVEMTDDKRNILVMSYCIACIQVPASVALFCSSWTSASEFSAYALAVLLGLMGICVVGIWVWNLRLMSTYRPPLLLPPRTIDCRLPLFLTLLYLIALLSLAVYLGCTWTEWTQHWLKPFVIGVTACVVLSFLISIGYMMVLWRLKQIWSSTAGHATTLLAEKSSAPEIL